MSKIIEPSNADLGDTPASVIEYINTLEDQVGQLKDAMRDLMEFQVKNINVWHNPSYDRCSKLLESATSHSRAKERG